MQISEVSKITGLSISTLRYYDKHGLLQNVQRTEGGTRDFSQRDLDNLNMIECLKNSGMQLKDIRVFMDWCEQGDSTIEKRLAMFEEQEKNVLGEMKKLEHALKVIQFKKWYYSQAKEDGTLDRIKNIDPNQYPESIAALYNEIHKEK
ncbi:MAG: MerR family transcriptional regulator [Firmicutes bacterium]|nr:MerR family transcriptional regulator [Bacillota bacterium]